MSEYIMKHTGNQLDQAIDNVLNGYIKPDGTLNITQNIDESDPLDISIYKWLTANIGIPEGYIKPIGNLTDSLITRASWTGAHKATLPEGYYVNTPINISEWKSGQITGNNTSGGTFNIPFSSIGFVPTWAVICLNTGISNYSTNIVLSYFSTSSAAGCIYSGSSSLASNSYVLKTGGALATFNDNGVTFPAISGVKYLNKSYRWFAMS